MKGGTVFKSSEAKTSRTIKCALRIPLVDSQPSFVEAGPVINQSIPIGAGRREVVDQIRWRLNACRRRLMMRLRQVWNVLFAMTLL
ncbi:hypothetical protein EVAR_93510_1 [Eumeta japonica]|uniref:Uncharacterized protein n=1 Tax=Eumeta variegata TaxID=151549 RepID=A0A4C1TJC2_EUMVA|nr:hypothetical protein EVAR_93510_1 [Eumeta japonica]